MIKGFHLDLKAQMPKFSYIMKIIERIADMGYNTLLLEYQDKFPYSGEYSCLSSPDALTRNEIFALKSLCDKRNIEIIPMVQCLGHMYWVTRFDEYASLGEHGKGSHSLCASNPGSIELFKALARDVMDMHPESKYFHIGADEVKFSDVCQLCSDKKKTEILAEHYKKALEFVKINNFTPVMWGDMIIKYDGLSDILPKDTVIMDWDYTEGLSFENAKRFYGCPSPLCRNAAPAFENTRKLIYKGYNVICAPAVRSMGDTVYMPRNVHFDNCIQSVYTVMECGALGFIVTSWAVRRVPHILTEPILFAASMLADNHKMNYPYSDIISHISKEYFGTDNADTALISFEFADILAKARDTAELLSSGQDFMDAVTGHFLSDSLQKRLNGESIYGNGKIRKAYSELSEKATELLKRIPDKNFSEYTKMLANSLIYSIIISDIICGICDNGNDAEYLTGMLSRLERVSEDFDIFDDYYTAYSMPSEKMARFGVYIDYIRMLLSSGKC